MYLVRRNKKTEKIPEGGFILIVALIGIMILMAIGYLALTISTSDLRIASRLVGERKAYSAAEAGVHAMISHYTGTASDNTAGDVAVDPVNDPHTFYSVTGSTEVSGLSQSCPGAFSIEGGLSWHCKNYRSIVTGRDTSYNSTVTIDVGIKGRAVPDTPSYDY
ncbi:MAG: pilus assembly PilX N-terminal domain-containing protein [Syntrophaceae bacterium]|nr:pilus assembly PilX N-terminal domain-containing protein [Syntrophaceae bacterium]